MTMAKTAKQVQGDIRRMLRDTYLCSQLSGDVYRNGYRPRDSRKEDVIVSFTTGTTEQIQKGIVALNIYVPDIDPEANGTWIEDGQRCEEIERLAQEWVESLTADRSSYKFELQQTIYTEAEPDINQHFVVVKLRYQYFGDDDNDPILASEDESLVVITPKNKEQKQST